ncbi:MAG: hypothetical protein LBF64_01630 [Oscillospiraceae bacterium]|jgi:hypothetical protein|nr:hypothetical protein [Oscillospiraceae bacterium]
MARDKRSGKREFAYEELLCQALPADVEEKLAQIPPDEELARTLTFSETHEARMKRLFAKDARRERLQTALR